MEKSTLEIEKAIKERFEWLRENGMTFFACDLAEQEREFCLRKIHGVKFRKSSYASKKDADWDDFMKHIDNLAELISRMPVKWQEPAIDRFMSTVAKGNWNE